MPWPARRGMVTRPGSIAGRGQQQRRPDDVVKPPGANSNAGPATTIGRQRRPGVVVGFTGFSCCAATGGWPAGG